MAVIERGGSKADATGIIDKMKGNNSYCSIGCIERSGGVCIGSGLMDKEKSAVISVFSKEIYSEVRPSEIISIPQNCPNSFSSDVELLPFEEE